MSALICGSMAYDTIMVFHDKFKNHILPEKLHILNVSFLVPALRREYGGCAGNIAYNLKLLNEEPLIMATVGHDFEPYAHWLSQCGISSRYIKVLDDHYTGQAYITTDVEDNQITAFHPGAMNFSHLNSVPLASEISVGIVSPDGKQGMLEHAEQFAELGIPFIFDPGQGMPMFDGDELLKLMDLANYATFNDYESELMQQRTGLSLEQLAERVDALIVTLGGQGSKIYTRGECIDIPSAQPKQLADPTGCGDAFRAGLLYGLMNDYDWDVTGRIASLLGAIKIEHNGTQNHTFTLAEFKARYEQTFGSTF
ncbi:carbohydrate kinase family protein [Methylomonas sp. MED-D]|uniref:Sugar kinase n=1 Tax=Methylomonas koyamae TaxID=702114 RepID=A0A177N1T0_9GAMM|nr:MULTISPECIES: carbohydrate kinase family protein [Methylomonas]NJA05708.1 carbohydrate kinase family protein [Methylococcaceae bacterium WWC4]MDT4330109.1 carbohydrate kinase family protein [Methylomonas sp. MV1]OAI11825.1 sugar kinase [Methylomonas koyamae]OHX37547.1 carbohydrate kinase family protein [Methylomonas sp. LWB]WGS86760.1 carbohydrate kinase family protein [Methylomonas sp. UP202]